MERRRTTASALCSLLLMAVALAVGCGNDEEGKRPKPSGSVTGEEVKREITEALDATKKYLDQKTEAALAEFERRMNAVEADLEEIERKATAARERGKEVAGDAYEVLLEKQAEARLRMEEFRKATAERKDEAAGRLDKALRDLEEAYRDFRDGRESTEKE